MAEKLSKDQIIRVVEQMTVLELADLVSALEKKFGVSAAPIAVSGAPTGPSETEAPKEEQTTFNVVLTGVGGNKISVIKAVREIMPSLGLSDAKTLVESAPKEVLTGVNKNTAEEAKTKLTTAGATVELK